MTPPAKVLELIERFERNLDAYKRLDYREARVRVEFIDPFFEALGWDVHNRQGRGEHDKDVIYEDAIRVGGKTRAPDYSFRVGQERRFFLEAKKPAISLIGDVGPAYQLRRYSWSVKLPLGVLTDFEEFAVYDCRQRPKPADKPTVGRIMYVTFDQYRDRWDEIYSVFAKESVQQGSFDRYVQETKAKRGASAVDAELLKEIEGWRDVLARNIALRNEALTVRELNFSVQRTIDRIIFLRMCEDRGIEDYGQLLALTNGPHIYPRLGEYYRRADEKYNAGLFDFRADTLTRTLTIDDSALKPILTSLYYPQCPYEFSVLPVEILGQVYEQFLGKVIRLTPSHRAKVEEKPEVKKAGGVYYTPSYIVDYIVQQTVGQLIEGKTPRQINKLRILDPACGSGSFLLGAYQYLLNYHRRWYEANDPAKHARRKQPAVYQGAGGDWRLTGAEKKRILLNNIYGVDIDRQAVEVTKLSLLLQVLEGETEETLGQQLALWRERALPDLGENIKCGNSLIGPDYFEAQLMPDEEEMRRVNAFNWEAEFAELVAAGGFDCVIGNPPYIRIQRIAHAESDYLFRSYESPTGKMDLSLVFLEKGLKLVNETGRLGFICTSQWLSTKYGKHLRQMLSGGSLHEIVDFGSLPVFQNASTYPAIFLLSANATKNLSYKRITSAAQLNLADIESAPAVSIDVSTLSDTPWNLGGLDILSILDGRRISWKTLKEFGKAYIGTKSGMNDAFVLSKVEAECLGLEEALLYPYAYRGGEVDRYITVQPEAVIIYPYREGINGTPELVPESELNKAFPRIHSHLMHFKDQLRKRQDSRRFYATGADWYRHLRAGSFRYIQPAKLVLKGIAKRASVGLLEENTAFDGARCPAIILENLGGHHTDYLLGILNSSLATYYLRIVCPRKLSGYIEFSATALSQTPIRTINFDDPADAARHDKMVALVERMLALHEKLAAATVPTDKQLYQRQIEATDRQIDRLVYELYGLTAEEIEVVESTTR